jgi:hypothetical protein
MAKSNQETIAMRVKPLPISLIDYRRFCALERKVHRDGCWWAVFSVNPREQVWPFVCYSWTPEDDRHYVPLDEYPPLMDVAGNLLVNVDEHGGRFFINSQGAFFKKEEDDAPGSVPEQFIRWTSDDPLPDRQVKAPPKITSQGTPITMAELDAKMWGR